MEYSQVRSGAIAGSPRAQERLLDGFFGQAVIAERATREAEQLGAVGPVSGPHPLFFVERVGHPIHGSPAEGYGRDRDAVRARTYAPAVNRSSHPSVSTLSEP